MRRDVWVPLLLLYLLLDFGTPMIEGAVSFDLADCEDSTRVERLRFEGSACALQLQPGLVAMTLSEQALRPALSPALAGAAPRRPPLVRFAFAASADPPDSAEDH